MVEKKLGQMEEAQRMAGRGGIPDDPPVGSALHQFQDGVKHVFFFDPRRSSDVIHEVIIQVGKSGDDFIDFRTELFLPPLQNHLGADLQAVEILHPPDALFLVPHGDFENVRNGRRWVGGDEQGFFSLLGEMERQGRGTGGLPNPPFAAHHDQFRLGEILIPHGSIIPGSPLRVKLHSRSSPRLFAAPLWLPPEFLQGSGLQGL